MKTLIAFHGDPVVKEKILARVTEHREAGLIRQNCEYMQPGDNSIAKKLNIPVACLLDGSSLAAYEIQMGIPRLVVRLEMELFERIATEKVVETKENWLAIPQSNPKVENRPGCFLSAIPCGADLSLVWQQFIAWSLDDPDTGVMHLANTDKQFEAIQTIAQLCRDNCLDEASWLAVDIASLREAAAMTAAEDPSSKHSATRKAAAAALWATAAAQAVERWAFSVRSSSAIAIEQWADNAFQWVLSARCINAGWNNDEPTTFWKRNIDRRNITIDIVNPMADKFLQLLALAPVRQCLTSQASD